MSGHVCEPCHGNGTLSSSMCGIFCYVNSVTVPPQHLENFSRALEVMQYQKHMPFAGTKYFLKAETLLNMSSAADDYQQNGQVITQHG